MDDLQRIHSTSLPHLISFISTKRDDPQRHGHLLVSGISGVGKTTLLRAVLRELDIPHDYCSCSTLFDAGTGVTEQRMVQLFARHDAQGFRAVIFDDLDVLTMRPPKVAGNDMEHRVLAVFKKLLDTTPTLLVIGITARPEVIDVELRRSGRFSQHVQVTIATASQRKAFLSSTLAPHLLSATQIDALAAKTHGFIIADLEHVKTEAFRLARCRGGDQVHLEFSDFEEAVRNTRPTIAVGLPLLASTSPDRRQALLVGMADIKSEIMRLIRLPLTHGTRLEQLRLRPPRGVLLYGPSGSGKTSIALECAHEAALTVIHVQSASVRSKYVGQSEKNLALLFKRARECAPSILFLDQMDQLFASRDARGPNTSQDRLIACLLTELDGITSQRGDGVFLLAATNRLQAIDPAVLRPGRLGLHLKMPDFDSTLRSAFVRERVSHTPLEISPAQEALLVDKTEGYTAAMMEGLFREAALKTLRENLDAESMSFDTLLSCCVTKTRQSIP